MRISSRKATLHRLPPAGVRWEWGDVVDESGDAGDDDDLVSKKAAYAVRELLTRHDEGVYETSQRLERYLQEKHGIELTGRCEEQARLPIDTTSARQRVTDGSGATGPASSGSVQIGLGGEDASDAIDEQAVQKSLQRNVAAGKTGTSKAEVAERDARQATMDAYATRVRVGPLAEREGDAYPDAGTRVNVDA